MGSNFSKCDHCCYEHDDFLLAKDIHELAETMQSKNEFFLKEEESGIYNMNFTDSDYLTFLNTTSEEYIRIFMTIPMDKVKNEEFYKLKEIVNNCYTSIMNNDSNTFEKNNKELMYLIKVDLIIKLGLKVTL